MVFLCLSLAILAANASWPPLGLAAGGTRSIYLMETVHHYHTQPSEQQTRTHSLAVAAVATCSNLAQCYHTIFQMYDPRLPVPVRVEVMAACVCVCMCVSVRLACGAAPSNEQLFHQTRQFMGWLPASLRAALNCSFLAKTQKLKHLLARGPGSASSAPCLSLDGHDRGPSRLELR